MKPNHQYITDHSTRELHESFVKDLTNFLERCSETYPTGYLVLLAEWKSRYQDMSKRITKYKLWSAHATTSLNEVYEGGWYNTYKKHPSILMEAEHFSSRRECLRNLAKRMMKVREKMKETATAYHKVKTSILVN